MVNSIPVRSEQAPRTAAASIVPILVSGKPCSYERETFFTIKMKVVEILGKSREKTNS